MNFVFVLLIALSAILAPAPQAQEEITLSVETMDAPGGCVITLTGVDGPGTLHGFTGMLIGDQYHAASYFTDVYEESATFYTSRWGWITFGGVIVFTYCHRDGTNNDLGFYVHGGKITNAEVVINDETTPLQVTSQPLAPTPPKPPEFKPWEVDGWESVFSSAHSHKTIIITVAQ